MRVGLSSAAFYGRLETEDAAAHVRDFPAQVCEVFLETHSEYCRSFGQLVRQKLGDLPCVSVHAKGTQFEPDLFGRSHRQVEDAMGIFAGVCDAGEALGAKYYVFHGPGNARNALPPDKVNALQERFGRMREIAAQRGMEVLWENVSWCSIRTPQDVQRARELLPGLHFVLDVKQALRGGVDVLEMIAAMGRDIRHVHVLDWDAQGELRLPGEGSVDWQAVLAALRNVGYDGTILLEPYGHQATDEAVLRRSLDYLHGLILRE